MSQQDLHMHGKLYIVCYRGTKLRDVDSFGTQDPYVKLHVHEDSVLETHVSKSGGTEPEWNDNFLFIIKDEDRNHALHVEVMNKNTIMRDTLIGQVDIPISHLIENSGQEKMFELNKKGESSGYISLGSRWEHHCDVGTAKDQLLQSGHQIPILSSSEKVQPSGSLQQGSARLLQGEPIGSRMEQMRLGNPKSGDEPTGTRGMERGLERDPEHDRPLQVSDPNVGKLTSHPPSQASAMPSESPMSASAMTSSSFQSTSIPVQIPEGAAGSMGPYTAQTETTTTHEKRELTVDRPGGSGKYEARTTTNVSVTSVQPLQQQQEQPQQQQQQQQPQQIPLQQQQQQLPTPSETKDNVIRFVDWEDNKMVAELTGNGFAIQDPSDPRGLPIMSNILHYQDWSGIKRSVSIQNNTFKYPEDTPDSSGPPPTSGVKSEYSDSEHCLCFMGHDGGKYCARLVA